jgi:hypothetical protein
LGDAANLTALDRVCSICRFAARGLHHSPFIIHHHYCPKRFPEGEKHE